MANYHNAVSDKLVVCFFSDSSIYSVFNKENSPKWTAIQKNGSTFPEELDNAIFSSTHCICALTNLVLMPADSDEIEQHFNLQNGPAALLASDILEDIKVAYQMPARFLAAKKKLVNYKTESDISIALSYFKKQKHPNAIYFYEAEGRLSVLVFKKGGLVLANRYNAENQEELFYYIMLAVEQLDLPLDGLHVECISTKGNHENLQALFKNYLPQLHLTSLHSDMFLQSETNADERDVMTLAAFFSQCVL